jgi:hypothetical protein
MTDAVEPAPPRKTRLQRSLPWLVLPLVIGGFAIFDLYMKGMPATASANAFVLALRAGRLDEARAHETIELRKRLGPVAEAAQRAKVDSGPELARAYEQVRSSHAIHGGFVGDWTSGCMDGKVDDVRPIWFVMSKVDGVWLVADLRVDSMPKECVVDTAE